MATYGFTFGFRKTKIKEPIIYQIGKEYKVVTNVRRADVRETTGWMDRRTDRRDRRDRARDQRNPKQRRASSIRSN